MRTIALILFIFILFSYGRAASAEDSTDYFPVVTGHDLKQGLEDLGVKNCQEFFAKYFNSEDNYPQIAFQASAYDSGVCVEQDLAKAASLYEQSYKIDPNAFLATRLALIYRYGPTAMRAPEKSDFFMKQSAITLAILPDEETRLKTIREMSFARAIPDDFKKHMEWIDNIQNKSREERRAIAIDLQRQGYKDTKNIWNEIEDILAGEE